MTHFPVNASQPFQVVAKPNGPRCNLACSYCYYLAKEDLYPSTKRFRMSDEVLEIYIRDYIASQQRLGIPEIWFVWQGGEPTMLGVDFFLKAVEFQKRYRPSGHAVRNALQTNGTLLDAEWGAFLKEHDFLVGLSIDGPSDLHNRYRFDRRHMPSFDKVISALRMLRDQAVNFNVLTVVHRHNAQHPRRIYRFLKNEGVEFIQFIPLVGRAARGTQSSGDVQTLVTPSSVRPGAYGEFLCAVFDEWIRRDVGRIFVQFFDVQLGLWMGLPASLCWFAETCGRGMALEHNGDLYACDHYVYPEYLLGNIIRTPIDTLANAPGQIRFGNAKRDTLPAACRACEYRFACNGGCPQHRFLKTPDGDPGLNYFCASYKRFFAHAGRHLQTMARLVSRGEPAARTMGRR